MEHLTRKSTISVYILHTYFKWRQKYYSGVICQWCDKRNWVCHYQYGWNFLIKYSYCRQYFFNNKQTKKKMMNHTSIDHIDNPYLHIRGRCSACFSPLLCTFSHDYILHLEPLEKINIHALIMACPIYNH